MTDPSLLEKPDVGRYGVWTAGAPKPEQAAEIEKLGYGALWVGASPSADLEFVEPILEATESLTLGAPGSSTSGPRPRSRSPSRSIASKMLIQEGFCSASASAIPNTPTSTASRMTRWWITWTPWTTGGVPTSRRVVAALGPKVLKLAAQRSAGAHPYLTTPEHTAQAHEIIGPSVFLAPEHKVVLTTDAQEAREVGRKVVDFYLGLSNYLSNWKRLGFTDHDVAKPGSDKLIDAVVAYGTPDQIARRLDEHLQAGADHVAIQALGGSDKLIPVLTELAGPLGLNP